MVQGPWNPESWKSRPQAQKVVYAEPVAVRDALARISSLPPLVTSWEIEQLKAALAEAQQGRRFVLQGGDCAEVFDECRGDVIAKKLRTLLQMSLVLMHGSGLPVVRVGRLAGQYSKPRSKPTELRDGAELPSYFGDLVNRPEFTRAAREPQPSQLLSGYHHAALTLNHMRALCAAGFADVRHADEWQLEFFEKSRMPPDLRGELELMIRQLTESLRLMESFSEQSMDKVTRVDFYTGHECLHLDYEAAQTREVPFHYGFYDTSAHFLWVGERTRALDGAHVEFVRGLRNPVGLKLGPNAGPGDVCRLIQLVNPDNEAGKVALITRLGAKHVAGALPPLIEAVARAGLKVLWVCDPMHGNTETTARGHKTRSFTAILEEMETAMDVHQRLGSYLGGVHFELTCEDVTECLGGADGLTEDDLATRYTTVCDPRLNRHQALEMSFRIARRMRAAARQR